MLPTILIKDIQSLSEARYGAGMMVEYLSFNFNPKDPTYLYPEKLNEIMGWLSGQKILGEHSQASLTEIEQIIIHKQLQGWIFDKNQINELEQSSSLVKILRITAHDPDLAILINRCSADWFLLENASLDFKSLNINTNKGILLGYDFNFINHIQTNDQLGFAFLGSPEERPGYGNYDALMDALEFLESQ